VQEDIACASRSDAKVLVTGESGVGKEVVARMIHQQSARVRAPLVTINCAGVPDSPLESELFGHERGSYQALVRDFNLDPKDYKRFLGFLTQHDCHVPVREFRSMRSAEPEPLSHRTRGIHRRGPDGAEAPVFLAAS
jgi:hypothetical protein